jgi:glutamyl-Q tRNA(Asp) synthetase
MYRGRFAPSPTGPLHFGSLLAAVASYLESATHHGQWLVRMEDVDTPRTVPGAADAILHTLEMFGFEWDGEIMYQSHRSDVYADALKKLQNESLIYPCSCSRREIADSATHGIDGLVYPGTCRHSPAVEKEQYAWRISVDTCDISFEDEIQGTLTQELSRDVGDFVLKRADGIFTYQLAVVTDDAAQDITHIVRGADLLDSTSRQIYLQQKLGISTPSYAHIPVAANAHGEKLSKQTLARPLDIENPVLSLSLALEFLGQEPPAKLKHANLGYLWGWARANWQLRKIPSQRSILLDTQEYTL